MNTYIHILEGRLRIKVPEVKGAPLKASEIIDVLQRNEGVTYVRANPTTGSVLVLFNSEVITAKQIVQALQDIGCLAHPYTSFLQNAPQSTSSPKMIERLLQSVFETAVQQAILALI